MLWRNYCEFFRWQRFFKNISKEYLTFGHGYKIFMYEMTWCLGLTGKQSEDERGNGWEVDGVDTRQLNQ